MKIRIKGDSIRFRLTQTEVQALSNNGKIYDSTNFGATKFSYGVVLNNKAEHLSIKFENNSIILEMPEADGRSWFANDIITFDHTMKTSSENNLYLLLEKDFTCLDNTIEDQSDNYPNPKLS
ncbi:hypothetical protein LCGC14_0243170 [marine sediment metagenome]|uniref:Uncharacterized protein n=1 Tax=marine sediment metagenome TaxID=412755 RepID=A0A0F9U6W0_9ZZZZ|nr:hypothetical protein [Maribacter sp.]HDZ06786.1 hypothetical protein [Maribacter sp.]HEA80421.1 hypothetical protein [Maribacter sp.]